MAGFVKNAGSSICPGSAAGSKASAMREQQDCSISFNSHQISGQIVDIGVLVVQQVDPDALAVCS